MKKLPSEAEIKARLRELTEAARELRRELQAERPRKTTTKQLRGLVDDRTLRSTRKKR